MRHHSGRCQRVFCVCPAKLLVGCPINFVASLESRSVRADRFDDSRALGTQNEGQGLELNLALTDFPDGPLVLAYELEVASYMTLNHVGRNAMVVPDELVGQSRTGKVGLRLRKDRLFRPSVHGDGKRAARERDLDRARVSKVDPLVDADIFRQDFGGHRHCGFLSVRSSSVPVLLPAVQTLITDGFQHFRVGSQARVD